MSTADTRTTTTPVGGQVLLTPGQQVGNYIIDRVHAAGGNSTIYKAHHTTLERVAAIKVLHQDLLGVEFLARFKQEAGTISRLHHPHIVEVFDIIELGDGRPCIVMEWLEGKPLSEELHKRGTFTPHELLSIIKEVGSALNAVHTAGFVHRDVKPNNIIALPDGDWFHIKLVDFGLVKLLSPEAQAASTPLTQKGVIIGTPDYMAPEQVLLGSIDARTDIYALGALMFQLITGRVPFVADDVVELIELHVTAPAPRASALVPVPAALDEVILTCLAKKPAARFSTVTAMLEALGRAVATSKTGEHPALTLGLGVHTGISVESDDEDEVLFHIDSALEETRLAFEALGLDIVIDTSNSVLAVTPLPAEQAEVDALVKAVLLTARALQSLFAARAAKVRLHSTMLVHLGTLSHKNEGGERRYVDGELLRLSQQAQLLSHEGLAVTEPVAAASRALDAVKFEATGSGVHRVLERG